MKILIVTQAVDRDSPTLGFFVEWLREFARQCEEVFVIGLEVRAHDLPANVTVVSMGKERGAGKFARLLNYWRALARFLPKCDGVFAHMCPEYVIAGWPLFLVSRKRVVLWFAHRSRNARVRFATILVKFVATSVPGAFTVPTSKVRYLGQGVPLELFRPLPQPAARPLVMAAIGRLTPIKRLELLVGATAELRRRGHEPVLELWGNAVYESDKKYAEELKAQASSLGIADRVRFVGSVSFAEMPQRYASVVIGLNACDDGAIDKAVLEAMAVGRPVVVTNRTFQKILGPDAEICLAASDPQAIADRVAAIVTSDMAAMGDRLRKEIEVHHGLPRLVRGALALFAS